MSIRIGMQKLQKDIYFIAKASLLIALLDTIWKVLVSVLAKRISVITKIIDFPQILSLETAAILLLNIQSII